MKRTQFFANSLLLLMLLLFAVSLAAEIQTANSQWGWVRAFAEAALVGALADWFAVTALFRRPLALPIPHTAIIPSNQARIADALGSFVQSNFLSEEILVPKVRELSIGQQACTWLAQPASPAVAAEKAAPIILGLVGLFDDPKLRMAMGSGSAALLRDLKASRLLAEGLEVLLAHESHQRLFDEALHMVEGLLQRHETFLREALRQELPWYVPNFIHNKVYRDVVAKIRLSLQAANQDSQHQLRKRFTEVVRKAADELRREGALAKQVDAGWQGLLENPLAREYVLTVLLEIQARAVDLLRRDQGAVERWLERSFRTLGSSLEHSATVRAALDLFIERIARGIARNYGAELAGLVSETVKHWDAETLVAKLEEHVGKDLQFIRINGTIVGGIVGLALHAILRLVQGG